MPISTDSLILLRLAATPTSRPGSRRSVRWSEEVRPDGLYPLAPPFGLAGALV